ncbi:MAG: hypothetical protein ACR2RL_01340 [Gammaproteobacteria bacterium]
MTIRLNERGSLFGWLSAMSAAAATTALLVGAVAVTDETGVRVDAASGASDEHRSPLPALDALTLPDTFGRYELEAGRATLVPGTVSCAAGEPVDPPSIETDLHVAPAGGKPFGIVLDDAFLPHASLPSNNRSHMLWPAASSREA